LRDSFHHLNGKGDSIKKQSIKISSGPLQGLTDAVFRRCHQDIWGSIDEYYGPYLRLDSHKEPKASQIRDIESPLNKSINFVPQILGNEAVLILQRLNWLKDLGYTQANWNLGCPYPMVTKRDMGAGLLNQPERVKALLEQIIPESPIAFSIKCRLGMTNEDDIFPLINVFNQFKIREIIIHARTASQMYKGVARPETVVPLIKKSENPIAYNGDINSLEAFKSLQELFHGSIHHFMLGRGLIMKPYLAHQIKGLEQDRAALKEKMYVFHQSLLTEYGKKLQDHQLIMKMRGFWEYFSQSFSNPHKTYKLIKKAGNKKKYDIAVEQIFNLYGNFEI